ncbi:hypothetical protein [Butyrivibrio proteoclasticus]|uniref:hypothetical protein n=1 Tax=Butyrivibrio proteoclasticus TaxID=43305 RepID=UPI00047C6540|nr:hypothetical protein [Butyrivibrio proteoclasticus]
MAADDKKEVDNFIVGGFEFLTEGDAQKAQMDLSKINLLKARAKAVRPKEIKAVYDKAIENKIFKTPIGWMYLAYMREHLLESGFTEDDLIPIPISIPMVRHSAMENLTVKQRIKHVEEKEKTDFPKIFSFILNIVLFLLVIGMFVVAFTSENDNIINYKKNVTNRYASWDEDLKAREKAVREAEKKLGITDTSSYYEDTDISNQEE